MQELRVKALQVKALQGAPARRASPELFNNDPRPRFTGQAGPGALDSDSERSGRDGKDRRGDNIFIEQVWRTVTDESLYRRTFGGRTGPESGGRA